MSLRRRLPYAWYRPLQSAAQAACESIQGWLRLRWSHCTEEATVLRQPMTSMASVRPLKYCDRRRQICPGVLLPAECWEHVNQKKRKVSNCLFISFIDDGLDEFPLKLRTDEDRRGSGSNFSIQRMLKCQGQKTMLTDEAPIQPWLSLQSLSLSYSDRNSSELG